MEGSEVNDLGPCSHTWSTPASMLETEQRGWARWFSEQSIAPLVPTCEALRLTRQRRQESCLTRSE